MSVILYFTPKPELQSSSLENMYGFFQFEMRVYFRAIQVVL